MKSRETIRTALESVAERRSRSALTILGILIGITAVILTVGLGEGAQSRVSQAISSLGTNLLIITPGSTTTGAVKSGLGSSSTLTLADAQALSSPIDCPDVATVAPVIQKSLTMSAGSQNWTAPVEGTTPTFLSVRNRQVTVGQSFTQADISSQARVALIGVQVAQNLFPGISPVGHSIDIGSVPFNVVGELNSAGASANGNEDNLVLIPITTAQSDLFGRGGPYTDSLSMILLSAKSPSTMSAAYQESNNLLLQLHHITNPSQADFTITPQITLLSTASTISKVLTLLLGGVAGIALLVGGIGVMNIMLVSVSERIREIGLRKALGATPSMILQQFLVEATTLGLAGGVCGVALGLGGALLLPHVMGTSIIISLPAIVVSVIVAGGIGLVFGVYPASRAARLSPIDALRSE